jgi:TolB-like protein
VSSDSLRFGRVELRVAQRQLLIDQKPVTIGARAFDVLIVLAERQGSVVTKAEIFRAVWPGVVVEENNLQVQIAALRKLLGPDAIMTIPGRGYQLTLTSTGPAAGAQLVAASAKVSAPLAAEPTLAVVPFDNPSNDPEMQIFSDGVSEEILHSVMRVKGLRVIGKSSSFQFRGADKAARKILSELNATHMLDGSVRRAGNQIRINAHLVETGGQTTLWSERYDRDLTDIFVLQDEIAAAIALALKVAFAPASPAGRVDPAAYDRFLHARAQLDRRFGGIGMAEAIPIYEEVVKAAPGFARAWGLLATARGYVLRLPGKRPQGVTRANVIEAAQTALKLDPNCGVAYHALCNIEPFGNYTEREALQEKALAAAPNDPEILMWAANFACRVGRIREALDYARRTINLDPLFSTAGFYCASMLGFDGRHDDSRILWDDLIARWPEVDYMWTGAIQMAAANGDWTRLDAIVAALEARGPLSNLHRSTIAYAMALRVPNPDYQAKLLARARQGVTKTGWLDLLVISSLSALGLIEETFELIEQASFAQMFDPDAAPPAGWANPGLIFSKSGNGKLMADPRFVMLCAKLGLCGYWLKSGHWPDCAEPGELPYDFKAEARRHAEAIRSRN